MYCCGLETIEVRAVSYGGEAETEGEEEDGQGLY